MSELMRPIPFKNLMEWSFDEYNRAGSIFGVRESKFYKNSSGKNIVMFGDKLSSVLGPAAGPNSQLAQNIIAAYLTGSRFVELKTVQKMDGEDLRKCIARPCINAEDECYNVEWSTEFTVPEAYDEYVKAWIAIHVISKELGISQQRDFAFNMSVGYDLEGIKSEKIDTFINGMIDASQTAIWKECKDYLSSNINSFKNFTKQDLDQISPAVSPSITLSTLHGCPPEEIERIAMHLLTVKKIHTYIKCNPTLLGYKLARNLLDEMGYGYLSFDDHHFKNDLQLSDAVPMIKRLMSTAKEGGLDFGVKITNTFPVKIKNNELPGEEMYMSGRSLYPLSVNVASVLSKELNGQLPISYSGGADYFNIDKLVNVGIQPITVATTILKPGGYERITQMAIKSEPLLRGEFKGIDVVALEKLASEVTKEKRHIKSARYAKSIKTKSKLNLFDCYIAPCKAEGCPINQQIPEYLGFVGRGKFEKAFDVIVTDNALPAVTGTICDHQCQSKCTRADYDNPVAIRSGKKAAVNGAQDKYLAALTPSELLTNKKAVVIGAGPAGIAVSFFLRRNGMDVTVLEKRDKPYGIVQYVIPEFRIHETDMEKDYQLAVKSGVNFKYNVDPNYDINKLKSEYDYVIIATGAWKEGISPVKSGGDKIVDALAFLEDNKFNKGNVKLGKRVAIIGGGDVAMDCARAAKRSQGVEEAVIVYRRTADFMPASYEEVQLAKGDNVKFMELLAPVSYDGSTLTVEVQTLSEERDKSGRRKVTGTGKTENLEFDSVIGAVGARVCTKLFESNNLLMDDCYPKVDNNCESSINNVYIAGDCKKGAATIVKAIADAKVIAKSILAKAGLAHDFIKHNNIRAEADLYESKGVLKEDNEKKRCLSCDQICEICTDVCPNRANVAITINAPEFNINHQILHIDGMCNECGNCGVFCPHTGNPYKDKVTLFWTEHDFIDSTNVGFLRTSADTFKIRKENGEIVDYKLGSNSISSELKIVIDTVLNDYPYYMVY